MTATRTRIATSDHSASKARIARVMVFPSAIIRLVSAAMARPGMTTVTAVRIRSAGLRVSCSRLISIEGRALPVIGEGSVPFRFRAGSPEGLMVAE